MFRMNEFRSVEWNILLLRKLNFIVPFLIFMLNKLKIKARFKWHWLTMDSWNFRKKTEHLDFSWQEKIFFGWQPRLTSDAVGKSRFVYVIRARVIPQCVLYHWTNYTLTCFKNDCIPQSQTQRKCKMERI